MSWDVLLEWLLAHKGDAVRVVVLLLCIPLVVAGSRFLQRVLGKRIEPQTAMLAAKSICYTIVAIIILTVLSDVGVRLGPLLGAAGVIGIAFGFAAQTSLSNLISGVFLILERPFRVGDLISVDTHRGVVAMIGLLSIRLRTFDNTLIRIPNETVIKSAVTNITAYPIRRMDMNIGVAYKEDMAHVMDVLREVADSIPWVLDEPEPLILFKGFGDSALEFTLGVWFAKTDFISVRNRLMPAVKERFDAEGIEIPFPHRTLYTGAETKPFPVRVVPDEKG